MWSLHHSAEHKFEFKNIQKKSLIFLRKATHTGFIPGCVHYMLYIGSKMAFGWSFQKGPIDLWGRSSQSIKKWLFFWIKVLVAPFGAIGENFSYNWWTCPWDHSQFLLIKGEDAVEAVRDVTPSVLVRFFYLYWAHYTKGLCELH